MQVIVSMIYTGCLVYKPGGAIESLVRDHNYAGNHGRKRHTVETVKTQ